MGTVALPVAVLPANIVAPSPSDFDAFDDRMSAPSPGFVVVRADARSTEGLLAHAVRRLRAHGIRPLVVCGPSARHAARELALQLGLPSPGFANPSATARALASAAAEAPTAILVETVDVAPWDVAVLHQLVKERRLLVVAFVSRDASPADRWLDAADASFMIGRSLRGGERGRWFGAVASEADEELGVEEVETLEAWWRSARATFRSRFVAAPLSPDAGELLAVLGLVGRSVPLDLLVAPHAAAELAARGLVGVHGGWIAANASCRDEETTPEQRARAVRLLDTLEPDPWDAMRLAELLVVDAADDAVLDRADTLARRAFAPDVDALVADSLAERWFVAVSRIGGARGLRLRCGAAEAALAVRDARWARRWCESASALVDGEPEVELLRCRALVLAGDLVAARVALQRIAKQGLAPELAARVAVQLGEVDLSMGRHDEALRESRRALSLSMTPSTRLAARNVAGKVLLAQSRWDEADAHFAEDTMRAIAAGERVPAMRSTATGRSPSTPKVASTTRSGSSSASSRRHAENASTRRWASRSRTSA